MPELPPQRQNDRKYVLLAFRIIGEFGAVIALPVVVLSLAGRALDERWGTSPWCRVAGFVLAAVITAVTINRRARRYGKEFESLG